jgi:hypothetical protein
VTVSDPALAVDTTALTVPKKTMLLAAVGLKPLPLIVTVVPTGPDVGLKPLITG